MRFLPKWWGTKNPKGDECDSYFTQGKPFNLDERTKARCQRPDQYHSYIECGSDHYDGPFRVTVGWSNDGYWIARCSGLSVGDQLGTHDWSKFGALEDLACSLATTIEALNQPIGEKSA